MTKKLLVSGLGGGLDVINASILYYAARQEKQNVSLGSSRTASISRLKNFHAFSHCGTWVNKETKIDSQGRYAEPRIAEHLGEYLVYLTRKYKDKTHIPYLRRAVEAARRFYGFSDLIFVDGGGDSLVLQKEDVSDNSEVNDPFAGGDAEVMAALYGIKNTYLAVISAGLDIKEERFSGNVNLLEEYGGYYGRVNVVTGEKEGYKLDHLIRFDGGFLEDYSALAENILVLSEADCVNPQKTKSHTAVVTYHALQGNYGLQRTFVDWEPNVGGQPGVIVKPEHCWMYFFDLTKVEEMKWMLNGKIE